MVASSCAGTLYARQVCEASGRAHRRRSRHARCGDGRGPALSSSLPLRRPPQSAAHGRAGGGDHGLRHRRSARHRTLANTLRADLRDDSGSGPRHGQVHMVSRGLSQGPLQAGPDGRGLRQVGTLALRHVRRRSRNTRRHCRPLQDGPAAVRDHPRRHRPRGLARNRPHRPRLRVARRHHPLGREAHLQVDAPRCMVYLHGTRPHHKTGCPRSRIGDVGIRNPSVAFALPPQTAIAPRRPPRRPLPRGRTPMPS